MDVVLMLCYFFPPLGGGGVQRSSKFAKFLPANGWRPVIVASQPNARNMIEHGLDRSLLAEVPREAVVKRCLSLEFSFLYAALHRFRARRLLIALERMVPTLPTNYKIGWYPFALRAARGMLTPERKDVVYSTSPPYSAHFVARRLQEEYGLPWVADFRDAWTQTAAYKAPTDWHARFERCLEARIVVHADAVIANTPANRRAVIERFDVAASKVHVIPNGFDPEDFAQPAGPPDGTHFVVACLGNLYAMPELDSFLRAFRRFADLYPEARLKLFGWHARSVRNSLRTLLREGTWQIAARVGHAQAIGAMRAAAVLLANVPGERATHWVPGKLYEYLAAERPILFIGPANGDAADVIRKTRAGRVALGDEGAILSALQEFHRHWRAGTREWRADREAIAEFDRRAQTQKLARILDMARDGNGGKHH